MSQFSILLKKDLMELVRTKRLLIIAIIFVVFALSSPLLAKLMPELLKMLEDTIQIIVPDATIVDSYAQFAKNISQICLYGLIAVFGGLIVVERRSGMYNNLLNNGVKRHNFVLSKVTAQLLVMTGVYVVSCLLFCIYNQVLFGEFWPYDSLLSFTALYVFLVFMICLINLFSVLCKSVVMAIVFGFLATIVIALPDLFTWGKYLPNHLISVSMLAFGDPVVIEYAWKTILIALGLSGVVVSASVLLCKSKDK